MKRKHPIIKLLKQKLLKKTCIREKKLKSRRPKEESCENVQDLPSKINRILNVYVPLMTKMTPGFLKKTLKKQLKKNQINIGKL